MASGAAAASTPPFLACDALRTAINSVSQTSWFPFIFASAV